MNLDKPTSKKPTLNTRGFEKGYGDNKSKSRGKIKKLTAAKIKSMSKNPKSGQHPLLKLKWVSLYFMWANNAPGGLRTAFYGYFKEAHLVNALDFVLWLTSGELKIRDALICCRWLGKTIAGKRTPEYVRMNARKELKTWRRWLLNRCYKPKMKGESK